MLAVSGWSYNDPTYPTPPTGAHINVAERYDTATDTWVSVNSCPADPASATPTGRSMSRAATYQNLVYLVGAQPGGFVPGLDVQKYTPTMDTWLTLNWMPTARASHGWELVGSKVRCLLPFMHCNPTAMCPLIDCPFSPAAARFW